MFDDTTWPWLLTVVGGPIILALGILYAMLNRKRTRRAPPPGETAREEYRH